MHFAASGGPDLAGKLTANVDGWTYDFGQQGYLDGFVAGKLGVARSVLVGGPQLPFILAAHKGFQAGLQETRAVTASDRGLSPARSTTCRRRRKPRRGLIEQGAELVWTSGDGIGNGVAAAAEQAGIHTLGVTGSAGGLAQEGQYRQRRARHVSDLQRLRRRRERRQLRQKVLRFRAGQSRASSSRPINNIDKSRVPADLQKQVDALVAQLASGAKTLPDFYDRRNNGDRRDDAFGKRPRQILRDPAGPRRCGLRASARRSPRDRRREWRGQIDARQDRRRRLSGRRRRDPHRRAFDRLPRGGRMRSPPVSASCRKPLSLRRCAEPRRKPSARGKIAGAPILAARARNLPRRRAHSALPCRSISRPGRLSLVERQMGELVSALAQARAFCCWTSRPPCSARARWSGSFAVCATLAAGGSAVGLVTHRISEVIGSADRVTVLRGGRDRASRPGERARREPRSRAR